MPDPVAAWGEALDDALAQESADWLDRRQRATGLAFGARALCTVLRPRFLRTAEYDALRLMSASLLGAFRVIGEAAMVDADLRAQFRLTDWEETLLSAAPRLDSLAPLSRLDAFIDPAGTPRITEYNGETPAGGGYCDALTDIFLALPAMRAFGTRWQVRALPNRPNILNVLLETWHRFRGVRSLPTMAIVDWDDVPTMSEFRLCQEYFQAMGLTCVITTPDALSYEGGVLRDEHGTSIDLIYKRVLIHELVAHGGLQHPLVRAVVDGATCLVNPFACKPLHKKASLAVLSDERNAHRFTAAQRTAITTHVPWTRVIEARRTLVDGAEVDLLPWILAHRDELVLKPNDDYGGAGIVLGWEADDATWQAAITRGTAEPSIVQRKIVLPYESFPSMVDGHVTWEDRIVDTAPFCYHGAWMDGLLSRISTSTLVNVTAGGGSTVPTFVVEPR
ncbi:MAG: hypothetical protein ABJC19_02190 [Gemmatimonadota bacterium]